MKYISLFFKGMGMGAANVIPGVSGGTIALITGIFEKLIHSIKSFDGKAVKLLFAGKWKEFAAHINLDFLIAVFLGIAVSILSIAKLFEYLFAEYPIHIWSFFFGLILASVYFVGKTITKWDAASVILFIVGTAAAISISVLTPAQENSSIIYLIICGVVAACSMILPGLSGSFVLILLGNYELVMINAVNELDFAILLPVVVGAGVGLIAFSHALSWVFKHHPNQTIAILTGFILGSLGILWPWKNEVYKKAEDGTNLLKDGEPIVEGYNWFVPEQFNGEVMAAIGLIVGGIIIIWMLEKVASASKSE